MLILGYAALRGTARLTALHREKLMKELPEWLIARAEVPAIYADPAGVLPLLKEQEMAVNAEGIGILEALWTLSERLGRGFDIDLRRIPLRPETVEITERLSENPYELACNACFIVASPRGSALQRICREAGVYACIVGETRQDRDKLLHSGEHVTYLNKPRHGKPGENKGG